MKIGDQYCSCEICDEGGTAFSCQEALHSYGGSKDSLNMVVGRTCSGNCIWSNDDIPEPTRPTPSTPKPTRQVPSTPEPLSPASTTPEPTSPAPTTPEPTSEEHATTVPTQVASSNILTPESTAIDVSFSECEHFVSLLIMLLWIQ
jgi:hypothetical protein